jgi:O-antigen ligase
LLLVGVAAPLLLVASLTRPEIVFVLFLTAGVYKQHTVVTRLVPFDVTVGIAAVLCVALLVRVLRRPLHIPLAALLLLPLLVTIGLGLMSPPNAYGAEKASRFLTLTCLATVSGLVFLDRREQMHRFLVGVAVLGMVITVTAVTERSVNEIGRLTLAGSGPIALARVGALTFAFGWLRFHFARSLAGRIGAAAIVILTLFCVLNSGSRGPTLSVAVALVGVSLITALHHGKSPISLLPLIVIAGIVTLLVSVLTLPYIPLHRFELLLAENKGTSVFARSVLFAIAWKLTLQNPLGIGVGGFDSRVPMDLTYPHNLFLEVGCELGWLPLAGLLALIVCSMGAMYGVLKREYSWTSLFLAVALLTALLNAMVSGDLNDNRVFFAVVLLPFVYSRFSRNECTSLERRA